MQLLQLPLTLVFSMPIDGFVPVVKLVPLPGYPACAAALSLLTLGGLFGMREGTVAAALAVGPLVRVINRALPSFGGWVPTKALGLLFADQTVAPAPRSASEPSAPAVAAE